MAVLAYGSISEIGFMVEMHWGRADAPPEQLAVEEAQVVARKIH